VILSFVGLVCMSVKHPVAVFRLSSFLQWKIAALRDDLHLLKLAGLGHWEPDIERFARIGDADGKRVIQLKVARLALGKCAKAEDDKKRHSRNSAQHGFLPFGSV